MLAHVCIHVRKIERRYTDNSVLLVLEFVSLNCKLFVGEGIPAVLRIFGPSWARNLDLHFRDSIF